MSIQCDTEGVSGQRKSHGFHRLRNDMVVVSEVFRRGQSLSHGSNTQMGVCKESHEPKWQKIFPTAML